MVKRTASRKRSSRSASEDAKLELLASDEPVQAGKSPPLATPARLVVVSYRCRLCDADGISAKAAIDGCVHRGLLPDDSTKYIEEISFRQVKVGSQEKEKTLLVFLPANQSGD